MKLLTAQQIREWDQFTIHHEPITSIELMERAAGSCIPAILKYHQMHHLNKIAIFCGRGNNGGDGLVIARLLLNKELSVQVYVLQHHHAGSDEFMYQLNQLIHLYPHAIQYMHDIDGFPEITSNQLIVDAIAGSGITGEMNGLAADLILHLNNSGKHIVSIDMPTGMPSEWPEHLVASHLKMIQSNLVLTFQQPKRSLLHAEGGTSCQAFEVIDIGLDKAFYQQIETPYHYIDLSMIRGMMHSKPKFSHKGTFGHLLCAGGSFGKAGAAALMSKSALRTGCGLVTAVIPGSANAIVQTAIPETMTLPDNNWDHITSFPLVIENYSAVAVGPGIGQHEETIKALINWLNFIKIPIVIDADALNIIAQKIQVDPNDFVFPKHCVITPHPKEFDRLAGPSMNSIERLEKQMRLAVKYNVVVVLKGAHTTVAMPDGTVFYNSSGNAAMAIAGSGDVLTGIIGSLLAQGYTAKEAALIGVFMHGLSGDQIQEERETLIASDLIEQIPYVMKQLSSVGYSVEMQ